MSYVILDNAPAGEGLQLYGAALDLWKCKDREIILAGPAETGKTIGTLLKLHTLLAMFPNSQAAMIRKTYKSAVATCVQTWENKILKDAPVEKYGGTRPELYRYPNGSQLRVGGMDNSDKILSGELDFAYINQAEELELDEWEVITTRCTGRAGNAPYAQMIGDCNPGPETHWILERSREGKLTLLHSKHEDNPTLYDPETGAITAQGKATMSVLDGLTGARKKRLRDGLWVSAEGQVFENWDPAVHLIDRFDIPDSWRRYRCIDFGFTNPFVCGWFALDEDERLYLYRYIYMTQRTVKTHSEQIKQYPEKIFNTICDHDASDRATLKENGIPNIAAKKAVSVGIDEVIERLTVQMDGRPRLFILKDSLVEVDRRLKEAKKVYRVEDEFGSYIWNNKRTKEEPIKESDHGMDMIRYMCMHLKRKRRKFLKL